MCQQVVSVPSQPHACVSYYYKQQGRQTKLEIQAKRDRIKLPPKQADIPDPKIKFASPNEGNLPVDTIVDNIINQSSPDYQVSYCIIFLLNGK